jgi:hypothetical protein
MTLSEIEPRQNDSNLASNVQAIIIALSAGAVLGLILIAQGRTTDKQFTHPMHSPNDRSRFATIRALGDNGTYAIGSIDDNGNFTEGSIVANLGWDTIDKVRRPDNGQLYSSKPPLLPTVLAGEYMLLRLIPTFSYSPENGWEHTGQLTFAEHPQAVVRILVVTANWVPFVIYLMLFSRLLGRITRNEWIRAFTIAAAGGGTYLSGFCVTLNNHTVAAFFSFFALYAAMLIWLDGSRDGWLFAVCGLCAAFAAVLELPALAFTAALLIALAWKDLGRCLTFFIPFALIPLAAHCLTTYQVTGSLMPAYGEKEWYVFEGSYWKIDSTGRLVGSSKDAQGHLIIGDPTGIDNQHEPWYVYLFHMWLGHHGVFSLTPVLIFSAIGLARVLARQDRQWAAVAYLALGLTALLVIFYTAGPAFGYGQRNYGGMCNGMRWLFWLIPLWLVFMPMGLEWKVECKRFRLLALLLLLISAASVFYATRNPWTRPWLQELLKQANWIIY